MRGIYGFEVVPMTPSRRRLVFIFFFLLIPVAASGNEANCLDKLNPDPPKEQGTPNSATLLASKVKALTEFMMTDRPSLSQAMNLLGGAVKRNENERYAEVTGRGYKAVIKMADPGPAAFVGEISIYPESEIGLSLKYLAAELGDWDRGKVIRSKTSYVEFPNRFSTGRSVPVYAELAFPPPDPDSPVLSIRIRREIPSRYGE